MSPDAAARAQCLAFPEAEEFLSHGAPNFRVHGGKVFAILAANHHGDGRLALWLKAEPGAQELWLAEDAEHYFIPPYVGTRGWIGVRLDGSLPWPAVRDRICESYLAVAPQRLHAAARTTPTLAAPDAAAATELLDPLQAPRARAVLDRMRAICLALPETSEARQFGSPVWKAGRKTFAGLHAYRGPLQLAFWVGVERQALMCADPRYSVPPYIGHAGWIHLDVSDQADWDEVRALAEDSYRHFALKRMLKQLDGRPG